ncbi:MAG: D-alanyl-D-alanine carboxypeptidase/D-alanyl-D-alanine-endopeptidase, partial [Myxococcota bacterium]
PFGHQPRVTERVWQLANRLYYNGVRRVRGDIVIDDSHFAGDRRALGFEQDRTSFAYMAPVGALSVSFNAIGVHIRPGIEVGAPAEVLLEPRSRYAKLEGSVQTIRRGRSYISVDVEPHRDRSVVTISGQISSSDYGRRYWRRIDNPPVYAGELIRSMMEQVGIRVDGRVRTGLAPLGKSPLTQISSPPLSALVDRVNKHSNNFMAEQIARAMGAEVFGAPGTWDKAVQAIDTFLVEEVGLDADSYALNNASGLHDVNRFSPEHLVSILSYMYRQPELSAEFIASLAVAGGAGTLSHRLKDTDAELMVRAKTGTLSISAALSGYVTAQSGEVLAFSMLVNDYETAIAEVWEAQDKVGTLLAGLSFGEARTKDAAPTASTMSIDE